MNNHNKNNRTIYIIDDDLEVCSALKWLFESINLNVETYNNATLFLQNKKIKQGCLIIDVRMPGISGLELLDQLKLLQIHLPTIVITGYGDIAMAVRAMKAGAIDFILKPFNDQSLIDIVQNCLNQTISLESTQVIKEKMNSLSERGHQVIELIIDGKLNKEIAYELSISISTVEVHRAHIMKKMQAKNLAQLIKMYLLAQLSYEYIHA